VRNSRQKPANRLSQRYNTNQSTVRSGVPVKLLAAILLLVLLFPAIASAQHPVPRGIREADQADQETQQNIPPPAAPHQRFDMGKLSQDASDLARLAQTIPSDVASLQQGILPKDTIEKLKQIEKLSKHLRSAMNP
jgi:hypothetical protein